MIHICRIYILKAFSIAVMPGNSCPLRYVFSALPDWNLDRKMTAYRKATVIYAVLHDGQPLLRRKPKPLNLKH